MPPPLDPDKRAQIADDIRAGGGCRATADKHDVSPSTVSAIAREDNIPDAFGRAQTKRATEARTADMAAWRAEFAQRLARRVEWIEERFDEQQPTVVGGREGAEVVLTDPTSTDVRNLMTAVGIGVDKIAVLTRDESQGVAAVDAWLHSLGVGQTAAT